MPESEAPKNKKGIALIRRIARELPLPLLMAAPAVLFSLLYSSAQYTLDRNAYENLKYEVNHFYYAGWPVESLRDNLELIEPSQRDEVADLKDDLHYYYDRDSADITDRIRSSKEIASILYLDKIAQPTEHLEELYAELDAGIHMDNYDIISNNLYEISAEIERLRELQSDDISFMAETTANAIESINTVGLMYGLSFEKNLGRISKIQESSTNDLSTYISLLPIKRDLATELDKMFIARGGVSTEGKRILISISQQKLYMIEDYNIIYEMPAATGIRGHGTAAGEFEVYDKVDMAWGYYEIWMPYWLTVYYSGGLENGIHGIPVSPASGRWNNWDHAVGNYPITYGCIMPHDWDAEMLYKWADIGIPVSIVY